MRLQSMLQTISECLGATDDIIDGRTKKAVKLLLDSKLDTDGEMSEKLYLLVSSLVPITNVDLLAVNQQG